MFSVSSSRSGLMQFFQGRGSPSHAASGSRSVGPVTLVPPDESEEDSSDDTVFLGEEEGGSSTEVEEEDDATSAQPAEPGRYKGRVQPLE